MGTNFSDSCSQSEPEFERNSLRDRLQITDSQIEQLIHQIERLEARLEPVLTPWLCGEAYKSDPEPSRSPVAQIAHDQGVRVYQAHLRLAELLNRVAI